MRWRLQFWGGGGRCTHVCAVSMSDCVRCAAITCTTVNDDNNNNNQLLTHASDNVMIDKYTYKHTLNYTCHISHTRQIITHVHDKYTSRARVISNTHQQYRQTINWPSKLTDQIWYPYSVPRRTARCYKSVCTKYWNMLGTIRMPGRSSIRWTKILRHATTQSFAGMYYRQHMFNTYTWLGANGVRRNIWWFARKDCDNSLFFSFLSVVNIFCFFVRYHAERNHFIIWQYLCFGSIICREKNTHTQCPSFVCANCRPIIFVDFISFLLIELAQTDGFAANGSKAG